jgi:hypothetical protein
VQYNSIKFASVNPSKLVATGRGDRLDHQDILTFGVENRIQTKRKAGNKLERVDLVSFNTFLDFSFGPGSDLLRTRSNRFTEARTQTILRPYNWLLLQDDTTFDLVDFTFSSNNLDFVLRPGPLQFLLSHRYARSVDVDGEDQGRDSQLTFDVMYQLNKLWSVGGYMRWEGVRNTLDEWEMRATRDLHDWLLDFGYNVRNSDRTSTKQELNKEVFVRLHLKAIPQVDLKTGHRASFSNPRIGGAVSGSNEGPVSGSYGAL